MNDINRHLGQKSAYVKEYDPTLLVSEPRQNNRTYLGIENGKLPFIGFDTWNAYEVSTLTDNGLPMSFVVKISYPCSSECIVESKSLKLYLMSFAMEKMGDMPSIVKEGLRCQIDQDLTILLDTDVKVDVWSQWELIDHPPRVVPLFDTVYLKNLESLHPDTKCTVYNEDPSLLEERTYAEKRQRDYHSSSLVSCCKVTGQPDSGDVFISMEGHSHPEQESLLRYIVSFRNENHFHEEICEAIWMRLNDTYKPDWLAVTCLYSRRGGIDINPARFTLGEEIESELGDVRIPHWKIPRQ